jgi:hypothetical protein
MMEQTVKRHKSHVKHDGCCLCNAEALQFAVSKFCLFVCGGSLRVFVYSRACVIGYLTAGKVNSGSKTQASVAVATREGENALDPAWPVKRERSMGRSALTAAQRLNKIWSCVPQRGPPHGLTPSFKRIKTTSTPHTRKAPAACHSPNCGPSWRFFVNSGVLHRCVPLDRPILLSTVQDDFGRRGASEHRKHLVIGVTAKIRWGPIVFENNVTSRLNQQSYDMPVAGSFEAVRRVCVFYYCSAIGQLSRSLQPPGQPPGRGVVKRAKCKSQKLNRNRATD